MEKLPTQLFDLEGLLKTTTTIPTYTPSKFYDQLVIYIDDLTTPTVTRLYIYSNKKKGWYYIDMTAV